MNRKVVDPTNETMSSASISTPITSSGKPIDTATPTFLIDPKLDELLRELRLRGASLIAALPASGRRIIPRLLPQPGGFEGLLGIEVDLLARDLAVADAVDARELAHDLDAALPTHANPAVEAHHQVIGFEDALDLVVDLGPGLQDLRRPAPDRVVALEGPAQLGDP